MSARIWLELTCDCCANTTAGRFVTDSRVPRKEMIAEARESGWYIEGSMVYCGSTCFRKDEPEAFHMVQEYQDLLNAEADATRARA